MRTPTIALRSLSWSALALLALLTVAACGAAAQELPAHTPDSTITRHQVPDVYKWDLTPLFASVDAWESKRLALTEEVAKLGAFQGKLSDPDTLLECLTLYFRLHNEGNFVSAYGALLKDSEQTNERSSRDGMPGCGNYHSHHPSSMPARCRIAGCFKRCAVSSTTAASAPQPLGSGQESPNWSSRTSPTSSTAASVFMSLEWVQNPYPAQSWILKTWQIPW